jgi:hypothetical protein
MTHPTKTAALTQSTQGALDLSLADDDVIPVAWRYLTPTGWHATTDAEKAARISKHHQVEPLVVMPLSRTYED